MIDNREGLEYRPARFLEATNSTEPLRSSHTRQLVINHQAQCLAKGFTSCFGRFVAYPVLAGIVLLLS
jgi:hypothetical protein